MSIGCLLHGCRTRPERKRSFQQFSQVPRLCQMKLSDKIPAPFGGACEHPISNQQPTDISTCLLLSNMVFHGISWYFHVSNQPKAALSF